MVRDELDVLRAANPVPPGMLAHERYAPPLHLLGRILATTSRPEPRGARGPEIARLRAANPVPIESLLEPGYAPTPELLHSIRKNLPAVEPQMDVAIDRIRAANPVPLADAAPPQHVLDRIIAEGRGPTARTHNPRRLPRRQMGLAGAFAIAIGAVVVGVSVRQPTTANAVLDRLSQRALEQDALVAGGGYIYTRSQDSSLVISDERFVVRVRQRAETWVKADGSGQITRTVDPFEFPTRQDRDGWNRAGRPEIAPLGTTTEEFGRNGLPRPTQPSLPGTVDGLEVELTREVRASSTATDFSVGMLRTAQELLDRPSLAPTTRANVLKVLGRTDGLTVNTDARDSVGRSGIGIAAVGRDGAITVRTQLIFDPDSGELMAHTTTALSPLAETPAAPPIELEARVLEATRVTPALTTP